MEYVKKGRKVFGYSLLALVNSFFFHLLFAKLNISSINQYLSCRFQAVILHEKKLVL